MPAEQNQQLEADYQKHIKWIETPSETINEKFGANMSDDTNIVYRQGQYDCAWIVKPVKPSIQALSETFKTMVKKEKILPSEYGTKVVRGFSNLKMIDRKYVEKLNEEDIFVYETPANLLFAVHGIGQKLGEKIAAYNFIQDVDSLRNTIRSFGISSSSLQILPICWRADIDLPVKSGYSQEYFEIFLSKIIVTNIGALRTIATDLMLDLFLYLTPTSAKILLESLRNELNRVYELFIKYHADATTKTKINIVAHSLGSVLISDLLSLKSKTSLFSELFHDSPYTYALKFRVENLFMVGSPIGFFLLLRNIKSESFLGLELNVKALYNVFHPYDPIACRIEPLIDPSVSDVKPVVIAYNKGGMTGLTLKISSGFGKIGEAFQNFTQKNKSNEEMPLANKTLYDLNPSGRIDFVLQEIIFENSYLSTLSAHTSYWTDVDFASFIIQKITSRP